MIRLVWKKKFLAASLVVYLGAALALAAGEYARLAGGHVYLPLVGAGPGVADNDITVCGELEGHRVWAEPVYTITCQATVPAGASLTIQPGTTVQFVADGAYGLTVAGQLTAVGTADAPIHFRSAAAAPAAGDWESLIIQADAVYDLAHVIIEHGGHGDSAQLHILGGAGELDNVVIQQGVNGLYAENTHLILRHSRLSDHAGYGLRLVGAAGRPLQPMLQNNEFSRNGSYPAHLVLTGGGLGAGRIADNRGVDNALFNGLFVQGYLDQDSQLDANHATLPYVTSGLTVTAGATLTLEPGVVFKFVNPPDGYGGGPAGPTRGHGRLTVEGQLVGIGAITAPIVFTSFWDDHSAYDTNQDADATLPQPGDWEGVIVAPGGEVVIHFGRLRYAGASGYALFNEGDLELNNFHLLYSDSHGLGGAGSFDVKNAAVQDNAGDGLHVAGPGSIWNSIISANGGYAVYNSYGGNNGDYRFEAVENYWGTADGPAYDGGDCFHDDLPAGSGGVINCAVAWEPFATSEPYKAIPVSPKKGLAYWEIATVLQEPFWGLGWYANYSLTDREDLFTQNPSAEFTPHMWCDFSKGNPEELSIPRMLELYGADYDGWLIWINEPELGETYDQCPLKDVYEAAQFYIDTKATFPYAKLVGPNNAFDANITPYTLSWLASWREAVWDLTCNQPAAIPCGYPQMNAWGMHLFGESAALNLQLLDDYYTLLVEEWGIVDPQIWITEMTFCYDNPAHVTELAATLEGFESRPYVQRYAFWANRHPLDNFTPPPAGGRCFLSSFLMDPASNWTTPSILGEAYPTLPDW